MESISTISGTFVPVNIENVDTDQIIPARFLKATTREGFGKNLFRDWRYENGNEHQPRPAFPLNDQTYRGNILVAGKNFGCGSSREHAAWALLDAGFRVVVSSFFADIFRNNALNNRVLPVQVSESYLQNIFKSSPEDTLTINLEKQTIVMDKNGDTEHFHINSYKKKCLLNGYDDIDYLISIGDEIQKFETANS